MAYVDGFVLAVPTANKEAFREHATAWIVIVKELGARRVVEAWGEDVPAGQTTSFPMAVKAEPSETVVFAWCEWPDKATRNAAMAKMMEDPRMKALMDMPYDGKRMIFGGFEPIVDL